MVGRTLAVLAGAALLLGLAGCYESPEATSYEPGVYKGKQDPLLEKQRRDQQQEELRQRFRTVQTDR